QLDDGLIKTAFYNWTGSILQSIWDKISNGTISIIFLANDTFGNTRTKEIQVMKDMVDPNIAIINPPNNQSFENSPTFEVYIYEPNLDKIWFEINSEKIFHTETMLDLNNTINITLSQALWYILPEGEVELKFYANDTAGNEAFKAITIFKVIPGEIDGDGEESNIIIFSLGVIIGSAIVVTALSTYHYVTKSKEPEPRIIRKKKKFLIKSSQEILEDLTNKEILLQIFSEEPPLDKRLKLEEIELTLISEEFLKKIDPLGFKEDDKREFIREMLFLSPKEREEIYQNILTKISMSKIFTSSTLNILNSLSNKKVLLQIFDEKTPLYKKSAVDEINLTLISEEFIKKVDLLGFKKEDKIEFIREMLSLSPKERNEIIDNIFKRMNSNHFNR
ncbi:MAG: hypothetical protein ACFFDN_32375, partial [Candidatus Hodarchaeota archaeon]